MHSWGGGRWSQNTGPRNSYELPGNKRDFGERPHMPRSQSTSYRKREDEGYSRRQNFSSRGGAGNGENRQRNLRPLMSGGSNEIRNRDRFRDKTSDSNAGGHVRSHKKYIGYQKLKTWANETNAGQLVLWIANESDALTDLLKENIKPDWYSLLVKICRLILSADHQKQALNKVLTVFVTSHFLDQNLFNFVTEKKCRSWPEAKEFYEDILVIIGKAITLLPEQAFRFRMPLSLLQNMVLDIRELESVKEDLLQSLYDLQENVKKEEWRWTQSKVFRKKALPYNDTDIPPEDFRTLSIIPEASDLTTELEPFVRAVLTKGAYRDVDHYLDVQFRLMREDFIRPLRQSINEFKQNGCKRDFKSSDIRLYFNVQIIGMTTVDSINHVLQFDVKSLKSVKWEHSKRFLNGSLLCLSKDNFETVLFATVAFRDPKNLKDGIINVEFKTGLETVFCCSSSEVFVMAETTAYFEAYYPILEGLKESDVNNSLQKYFIYSKCQLQPPKYLLGGVRKYELSSLTKDGCSTPVPILNTMSWPPVEKLNLNESQREAAQLALTKELAVIQGPPGTGKTYVGLKVMRILLENQTNMAFNEKSPHDPILVVCYTNHALDQFLEGVMEFCPEGVVRVGGKNSSTLLEKCNLKSLKKNQELKKTIKIALFNTKSELQMISSNIKTLKKKIDGMCVSIQHETILETYMSPEHYISLTSKNHEGFIDQKYSQTKYWLNSLKSLDIECLPEQIKRQLTKLVLQIPERSYIDLAENNRPDKLNICIKTMSAVERARVYQGWLNGFRSKLDASIYDNVCIFKESTRRILSDAEIIDIIPKEVLKAIRNNSGNIKGQQIIEHWVLGLDKSLSDQLDDVADLIHYFSQSESNNDDDFDDIDGAVDSQNARKIDTDQTEEDEIATATAKIREGDVFLMLKAEKVGLGNDVEENENGDDSHWQTVTHKKPLSFLKLRKSLTEIQPMTEEEEKTITNIWSLDIKKRFSLYNLWIQRYKSKIAEEIKCFVHEYKKTKAEKMEIRMECDLDILRQARVIGMTTTGAAKYRALLQAVACRIIVVEEAAEVLEAHIITALNQNCQHLILIGDHQQLRPNPTVYTLAKDYHLDLSLFERLINNGIQHVTLKEQHRMRQSISKIIRHIYPDLQDHISVTRYENVRGIEKDIYFINHEEHESTVSDSKSKSNTYEASFLVALLKYFLLQGYESSQITILSTYVGQILILKKEIKMKGIEGGVRVTTVDNFQGEENDIILLSLVRSNEQSNVGFLKIDNRVCVALSRAKKGLFAIGNFEMLSSKSKLWEKIVETAKDDGVYGDALPVVCPNHPSFKVEISSPEDFVKKCPEGGCGRPCEFRLQCGHTCHLKCHGYDKGHEHIRCNKRCGKKCPQGHPCKKMCYQDCDDCEEKVKKIIPHCGHEGQVPCHLPPQDAVCSKPCGVLLECHHHCTGRCAHCHEYKEHAKCRVPVDYFWPCDHICKVPCYMKPTKYPCPEKCQAVLECGHKCTGTCSECLGGVLHIACKKVCTKILSCGHQCSSVCGIPCPPCSKVCSSFCRHGKCDRKGHACGDNNCIPCQEPCLYKCSHRKCGNKCHEICDIEPCKERCRTVLRCNHQCSGLCGELCVCAGCDLVHGLSKVPSEDDISKQKALTQSDGQIKIESKSDNKQLKQTSLLIKIPSCGHIFQVSELDSYVENLMQDDNQFRLPCPICKKTIEDCFHYNKMSKIKYLKKQQEKNKVLQANKIKQDNLTGALISQQIVQSKDFDGIWSSITGININDFRTNHEIKSFNLKAKYVCVLSDMQLLKRRVSFDESPITNIIKAVQKLGKNLTQNQISDFQKELKHLLLLIYVDKLEEHSDLNRDSETKNKLEEIKKSLKKRNYEQTVLTQLKKITESMEEAFQTANSSGLSHADFTATKRMMERDWAILDSEADKTLDDLVF